MQCWKSLLNLAPPRKSRMHAARSSQTAQSDGLRSLRGSQQPQSEVRELELRCICPSKQKDLFLLHCWRCAKSQHAVCYFPNNPGALVNTSHQCLHCEQANGSLQEPPIVGAVKLRQAGNALRTWCGDVQELAARGDLFDYESWENAGMLVGLLVRLITSAPYITARCGEAASSRMRYHAAAMKGQMSGCPPEYSLDYDEVVLGIELDGDGAFCPEEEFADTAMSLVQGLVEVLPALLG
jgi:hypothetical protein